MPEPQVGGRFGRYSIEGRIGAGGMGSVYRARDLTLNRLVALKVMHDESGDPNDDARLRFSREARILASISAPGVVEILDVGDVDGTPYLAMKWIDGQPLSARLRGVMPSETALALLIGVAESLRDAHRQGVVHRDLKPANVVIDRDGRPILVDFGIAKRLAPAASPHPSTFATREDLLLGTPSYMAPEQTVSTNVDARADQFAWGVIAYQLLAGLHPRHLAAGFPLATPPPLATQRPELPGPVTAAVDRALARTPDARFASMDELLAALTPAQEPAATRRDGGARAPTRRDGGARAPTHRDGDARAPTHRDGSARAPTGASPRSPRWRLFVASAAAPLLAAGLAVGAGLHLLRPRAEAPGADAASAEAATPDPTTPDPTTPSPPPPPSPVGPPERPDASEPPVTPGHDASTDARSGGARTTRKRCRCMDAHGYQLCFVAGPACSCPDPAGALFTDLCKVPWVMGDRTAECQEFGFGEDIQARGSACVGYRRGSMLAPVNTVVTSEVFCSACRQSNDIRRPGVAGARCEGIDWLTGAPAAGKLECAPD